MQEGKISRKEAGQRHRQAAVKRRCPRNLGPIPTGRGNVALHVSSASTGETAANSECPPRRTRAIDSRSAGRVNRAIARQRAGLVHVGTRCGNRSAVGDRQDASSASGVCSAAHVKHAAADCPLRFCTTLVLTIHGYRAA